MSTISTFPEPLLWAEQAGSISHLADSMPQLVWMAGPDGQVVYYNRRVEEFAGASRSPEGRWSWEGLLHEDDSEATVRAWDHAVATATVYEIEHRVKMKDGSYKWHLSRGYPQKNEDGEVLRWFGTATNIHEQKLVEEKIREAEERWRTALEAAEIGTWDFNPRTRAMYFSDVAKKIRGIHADPETFFDHNLDSVHPDDKEYVATWIPTLLSSSEGKAVSREYRIIRNGEVRWLRSVGRVYADAGGTPLRAIGTLQDITEEKNAADKMHYLSVLTDNIVDAVVGTDMDYRITSWNRGAERIYGWSREEVMGKKAREVVQTEFLSGHPSNWQQALDTQGYWQGEVTQQTREGKQIFILASIAYVHNERREPIGAVAVNKDITAQHEAAQMLRESEERYATTVLASDLGLWDYDVESDRFTVSGNISQIYGIADGQFYTLAQFFNCVYPDDLPNVMETYHRLLGGEGPAAFTIEHRITDQTTGAVKWIRGKGKAFFTEDRKLYRSVGTVADITRQKESEQQLKRSEEQFRLLTNTIPQIVWITGSDGRLEYLNEQWTHITGQTAAEGLDNWQELLHPEDLSRLIESWKTAMQQTIAFQSEFRIRTKEGAFRWFFCNVEPMLDREGRITRWIGASTDIQDFKDVSVLLEQQVRERTNELARVNQALKDQATELRRSNEDLQQFAHVASHDLKEPLRKIKTYESRLREEFAGALPQKAGVYLQKIQSAAARMGSMIDGVLEYSLHTGSDHSLEAVDLHQLLSAIEADLEIMIQQKQATIRYEQLPVIEGASILLYQLFYNLLNNALKFSMPGRASEIRISAATLTDERGIPVSEIRLQDNGIGFDNRQAEIIFKTFTRLQPRDQYEGTGLGLALCHKIVERHGGSIRATGALNAGACFIIQLPLRQSPS